MIRYDLYILVEPCFAVYSRKLHQSTMMTGNDVIDDVIITDDIIGHVTHINKQSWDIIKRGDLDVPSEDQMVVLQEALSIDNLKSWSTSQVFLTLNVNNLDIL